MSVALLFFCLPVVLAITYSPKFIGQFGVAKAIPGGVFAWRDDVEIQKGKTDQDIVIKINYVDRYLISFNNKADPYQIYPFGINATLIEETAFKYERHGEVLTYRVNDDGINVTSSYGQTLYGFYRIERRN